MCKKYYLTVEKNQVVRVLNFSSIYFIISTNQVIQVSGLILKFTFVQCPRLVSSTVAKAKKYNYTSGGLTLLTNLTNEIISFMHVLMLLTGLLRRQTSYYYHQCSNKILLFKCTFAYLLFKRYEKQGKNIRQT